MTTSPREQAEALMTALLPYAEQALLAKGAFSPYGGYLSADGTRTHIPSDEWPEDTGAEILIELLTEGLRKQAARGGIQAAAIFFDARVVPPGAADKTDAIAVRLEHIDDYSVQVYFPYRLGEDGQISFGDPFAYRGPPQVFASLPGPRSS